MKRRKLIRHLRDHGCELARHGGEHDIFVSEDGRLTAAVERHREISWIMAVAICKQLDIPRPTGSR